MVMVMVMVKESCLLLISNADVVCCSAVVVCCVTVSSCVELDVNVRPGTGT
jgi:hypothetical protein